MKKEQDKYGARRELAQKRKKQLQKMQNSKIKPSTKRAIWGSVAAVVAVLIIAVLVFFNAGFTRRWVTALQVGDEKVSTAEFNYYYTDQVMNTYNTYYQYFGGSYMPFDTTKSLRRQKYSDSQSWSDYFVGTATSYIQSVKTLKQAAKGAGYQLSPEGVTKVEAQITNLKTYAKNQNLTVDRYLTKAYGLGMNENVIRGILTDLQLANEYEAVLRDKPTYTDEDLEAYYKDSVKETYTYVDIRYLSFDKVDATASNAGKTLEQAKEEADKFMEGIADEEEYSKRAVLELKERATEKKDEVTDTTLHENASLASLKSMDEAMYNWAVDESRKAGDMTVITKSNGNGYYAVYLVQTQHRFDYQSANIRQIFLSVEDTSKEEDMKKAKEKAESLLAEWKAGAATEESFAALADANSALDYEGGLQKELAKGSDDISAWIFDAERKPGDTAVLESSGGYHVVYFVGLDREYWKVQVESALRSDDFNKLFEQLKDQYTVTRGVVGLWMRSEPF
ncbi:MAG: peptidylprolyl isomerase [Firmicutes bacterium]|nr:peptidylprolyl isomerase [Bacillota bacterium]